jgi:hypothetical protein
MSHPQVLVRFRSILAAGIAGSFHAVNSMIRKSIIATGRAEPNFC